MMQFLRLSSIILFALFVSCATPYKHLQPYTPASTSALRFKPEFDKVLYRCVVDGRFLFKRFHLSGLLFFKKLEDSTTRAVFQNEMGFTFFDFEWTANDQFRINHIIPQLDKPALIKTLQKDMNLLLMKNLYVHSETVLQKNDEAYYRFNLDRGVVYYIVKDNKLQRIENAGKTKVITISLLKKEGDKMMPASVIFEHHKANFTIELHKIDSNAVE